MSWYVELLIGHPSRRLTPPLDVELNGCCIREHWANDLVKIAPKTQLSLVQSGSKRVSGFLYSVDPGSPYSITIGDLSQLETKKHAID